LTDWDIVGHEWAVEALSAQVAQGRLRHAYLFTGSPGVGRRTLALRLAQAVNCLQPPAPGAPCRACRACQQIERMQHPDLSVIQAEQVGGRLKVEQVRSLQHSLALAPYEARCRFALLLRFEEANDSAANALLKTLEEPNERVVLALTADSLENLLPTIVSRCTVIRLRPAPVAQVEAYLAAQPGIEPETARLAAHLSGGRAGFALRLAQDAERRQQRLDWLQDHQRLLSAGRVDRFHYAEKLARDKPAARLLLGDWLLLWRDVLLRASGAAASPANVDCADEIERLAARCGAELARQAIAGLEQTQSLIDRNINARLALEVMLLNLPRL
jgi:DNA polymerase-3 subunit delta'